MQRLEAVIVTLVDVVVVNDDDDVTVVVDLALVPHDLDGNAKKNHHGNRW